LLGWALKDAAPSRIVLGLSSLAAAAGIAFTIATSYLLSVGKDTHDLYFSQYETVATYASAVAAFLLAGAVPYSRLLPGSRTRSTIAALAGTSLGVYLVHIAVRDVLTRWSGVPDSSLLYMTGGTLMVYVLSVIVVVLLQQVPVIRRLVPA
jgi:surface polysaccharide O-acyltransferase-like enzyme